jgi:RimJ/RimL family protein N-acetyltransferase
VIERTFDYRIVNRFADFVPVIDREFFYLREKDNDKTLGVWTLHPYKDGVLIHAGMGARCRGKMAIRSAKRCFDWIWSNTAFDKIYARIPQENKPACRVASLAGMRYAGTEGSLRLFQLFMGC